MGAMRVVLLASLLAVAPLAEAHPDADPVARWRPIVAEASRRFDVPIDWIERVIRAESGGRTTVDGKPIRSRVGAMGLMQLMPATWAALRVNYHLGADPDDPHDNIVAGTAFLAAMRARFGYPGMFAAYSAGPSRYAAYLAGRSRLPGETITYVARLTGTRSAVEVTTATPPRELLFVLRHDLGKQERRSSDRSEGYGLFAIRKGQP